MHARFASPITGRFLSIDPVLEPALAKRMPQRWNRYLNALGNPQGNVDPDGRSPLAIGVLAVAERAAIGAAVGITIRLAINAGIKQTVMPSYPLSRGLVGSAFAGAITGGISAEGMAGKLVANVIGAAGGVALNGLNEGKSPDQIASDMKVAVGIGLLGGVGDTTLSARIAIG